MPLSELYNAVDPQGVVLNAGVFGGQRMPGDDPFAGNRGQFPDSYKFAKNFVWTNPVAQGSGNGVTSIDDPTYLGFSLRFDILSPLFNGATEGAGAANGESAVGYLEAIGETTRAGYLRSFIQGLQQINTTRPYYWQTIEGLTEAWNKSVSMIDPFSGTAEGEGITIGCLEALDLKISALFNLYKAAVYDVKYKRTVLPPNLMHFNVYVDIQEIRKFKTVRNWLTAGNPNDNNNSTLQLINENTATITFLFEECKWDVTAAGKVFEGATNAGGNPMAVTSMKWSYSRTELESQFPGYGSALKDNAKLQPMGLNGKPNITPTSIAKAILDNAAQGAKDAASRTIGRAAKGALNTLERRVRSAIQNPLLGNVFGARNSFLSAIQNPQILVNAVAGAAGLLEPTPGQLSAGSNTRLGDMVYSGMIPPDDPSMTSSNIFGPGPSGPAPLDSTNVFE